MNDNRPTGHPGPLTPIQTLLATLIVLLITGQVYPYTWLALPTGLIFWTILVSGFFTKGPTRANAKE